MKVITAETAPMFVRLNVRYVDTRTDCVPVRQDGRAQDVLKVIFLISYIVRRVVIYPRNLCKRKKQSYLLVISAKSVFSVKIPFDTI